MVGDLFSGIADMADQGFSMAQSFMGDIIAKREEEKMLKELNSIQYSRPEEYDKIMSTLGQRVSGVSSRREAAEDRVRDTTASGISGIRQLADSPVAALGAFGGLKQREQQAIADLGIEYEGIRDQAVMDQVSGLKMGADYSEKEDYYNDMYKKMVRANIAASKMQAGESIMWGGLQGLQSSALDFAGTMAAQSGYGSQSGTSVNVYSNPAAVSTGMSDPGRTQYSPPSGTYDKIGM